MKRLIGILLVLSICFSTYGIFAEEPEEAFIEEDDSVNVPLELPEEDELEEEVIEWRELKYGDEGDDVLELQTKLHDLNYYNGNISGRYREATRAAVKSFQEDFKLEQTGIADITTQSLIYSTVYRPLRYGSSGDDVKDLQTRLMELGYYKGKISGNYLEGTQSGINNFQKKNALELTGYADSDTQNVLFSASAIGMNDIKQETAVATPVPDESNFLVDDQETALENGVNMSNEPIPFSKTLKSGSSGKVVKQLQERLNELGYYDGPISGNFAKQTLKAVKAVQVQNGIQETGKVDETTWNIIFNDSKIVLPEHTPKPTASPTPVPFSITVDVANQVTTVYGRDEQGEYTVIVRQMLCSTGTKANPSDVGDWVLSGRHANWCVFPKWGNSYARYWTKINGSIAFHSVIYNAVSLSAVDVKSYKNLGKRASHGCIRLTVADAKWIYDNVGKGTVVSIVEGMKADPELRDALSLPPFDYDTYQPQTTPVPTPEPDYLKMEVPTLTKNLKSKSSGEEVYWVQKRLTELGYYTGKCSGKMLGGTVEAVKAFQKANGLSVNGVVNRETLDAMVNAAAPSNETASPTPAP